jgi:hypothetical protein
MSNRDAAVLTFVGLGLLTALSAVGLLQATVVLTGGEDASLLRRIFVLVPTLFLAWAAMQLIRNRAEYAERLFPVASPPGAVGNAREWQLLGVVLVGLYVLLLSLPELLTWVVDLASEVRDANSPWAQSPDRPAWSLDRALLALTDSLVAAFILVQRHEVVARLFPAAEEPDVQPVPPRPPTP